jgi:integrase
LLSSAVNFCNLEFDLSLPNPVTRLGLGHSERRVRWITKEEAARLLGEAELVSARPHLPVFILLAFNTGCRRGELLGLEWDRVDMLNRKILLEARHTKTRRRRTVPLNQDALCALMRIQAWQMDISIQPSFVFADESGKIRCFHCHWCAALRRAGIENFRIHDMRHTFASWLVMDGVSIYIVKDLLGHASVTQTEIYAHLAPDQSAKAVEHLLKF